jgi:hypothetical protein
MRIRDEVETVLRAWDKYEVGRGKAAIIDFDCFPAGVDPDPAESRIGVYDQLSELRRRAEDAGEERVVQRIDSHLSYLRAVLGERQTLGDYIRLTQGKQSVNPL